ncbi:carbohydrate-binding protein [Compostibacter hankyongensis]|uniref:CBM6 domain-containing protein n=1 Tax=Compostibacter hankyongensis TaxID=1007089 RepID=A0ABP8FTA9_9BACT
MKKSLNRYLPLAIIAGFLVSAVSCRKTPDEYRYARPVQQVSLNTYDFLKTQEGLYDTLLYLLDETGLTDTLKTKEITFFAPQDYSIMTAMHNLNVARIQNGDLGDWTLDSVPVGMWDTLLHRYMVAGIVDLDSLNYADGVTLKTPYGYEMNGRTITTGASGIKGGGSKQIEYSDKNNSRYTRDWVSATTRTVNLKTENGMLHILASRHVFGFSSFVDSIYPLLRSPFQGKWGLIPGTIEAANYDEGGEGVAYHDLDAVNQGNAGFRISEGVDLAKCSEGLYNIGYTNPGEWTKYSVEVQSAENYLLNVRVATTNNFSVIHVTLDGEDISGPMNVVNTKAWQTWKTIMMDHPIHLKAGKHTVGLFLDAGSINLSRFGLIPVAKRPYHGTPLALPGTILCNEFDYGGEGLGYHDTDADNKGNARVDMRFFEGVDLENCAEGGYDVGTPRPGEWIAYTVNVAQTGQYEIISRVASAAAGGQFHLQFDGQDIGDIQQAPATGGWQAWTDVKTVVTLTAGVHELRYCYDSQGFNWQKMVIVPVEQQ